MDHENMKVDELNHANLQGHFNYLNSSPSDQIIGLTGQ